MDTLAYTVIFYTISKLTLFSLPYVWFIHFKLRQTFILKMLPALHHCSVQCHTPKHLPCAVHHLVFFDSFVLKNTRAPYTARLQIHIETNYECFHSLVVLQNAEISFHQPNIINCKRFQSLPIKKFSLFVNTCWHQANIIMRIFISVHCPFILLHSDWYTILGLCFFAWQHKHSSRVPNE